MTSLSEVTLEDAIKDWDRLVEIAHPLFDLTVDTNVNGKKNGDLLYFATNHQKIFAHLYDPKKIDDRIEKVVAKLYQGAYNVSNTSNPVGGGLLEKLFGDKSKKKEFVETLMYHTYFFVMNHELSHSLFMPNGKEDRKLIRQALADGIKKALPQSDAGDIVNKAYNVENTITDFGIDTIQYYFVSQDEGFSKPLKQILKKSRYKLDGKDADRFPEAPRLVLDSMFSAEDDKIKSSVWSVIRYVHALTNCQDLETRKELMNYFEPKIRKGGIDNVEELTVKALKGIVKEVDQDILDEKKINRTSFENAVEQIYKNRNSTNSDNRYLISTISSLLMDEETKYDAINGFIQPLAHLIDEYEGPTGPGPEPGGGGGEPGGEIDPTSKKEELIEDLIEDMEPGEVKRFMEDLANHPDKTLAMFAKDEYYKKHSPDIEIVSPQTEAVVFNQGKIKIWEPTYSQKVPVNELHKHQRWIDFALKQGLTPLNELMPGKLYVVNYFDQKEIDLKSHDFQQKGLDLPRNWVILNDSSGSMGGDQPGCGSEWDALNHINYGLLKTLYNASEMYDQEVDIWVVNFSNDTIVEGPQELKAFYESRSSRAKANLLTPQHGGTTLNPSVFGQISRNLSEGRTVWSFATDGGISGSDQVYRNIEQLTQNPETSVLFFEMFYNTSLGSSLNSLMNRRGNVFYKSVTDMNQILSNSIDVLLKYEK